MIAIDYNQLNKMKISKCLPVLINKLDNNKWEEEKVFIFAVECQLISGKKKGWYYKIATWQQSQ